jgi:hypothetical protein
MILVLLFSSLTALFFSSALGLRNMADLAEGVSSPNFLSVIGNKEADSVGDDLHAPGVDHDLGTLA